MDLPNRCQIPSKRQNLWFFCLKLDNVNMSEQTIFCPNFVPTPTSVKYQNVQIYTLQYHTLYFGFPQSISPRHVYLDLCERVRPDMHNWYIHLFAKSQFVMICMKNNYCTKLKDALPNRFQIDSKPFYQEFGTGYLSI